MAQIRSELSDSICSSSSGVSCHQVTLFYSWKRNPHSLFLPVSSLFPFPLSFSLSRSLFWSCVRKIKSSRNPWPALGFIPTSSGQLLPLLLPSPSPSKTPPPLALLPTRYLFFSLYIYVFIYMFVSLFLFFFVVFLSLSPAEKERKMKKSLENQTN